MQYFVSIENSSYFYWQIELLIESFLMQGLEDKLVIGIAENNSQKIKGFSGNLVKHPHKFMHPNDGKDLGYMPVNRINSLRTALVTGILKFPFTLIHADMILRNPVDDFKEEYKEYGVILNNFEDVNQVEVQKIKQEIKPSIEKLARERGVEVKDLPPVTFFSGPVVFRSPFEYFQNDFFSKLQINLLSILEKNGGDFPCEKAAWELTLIESFQHCGIRGDFLAAPLMHANENMNFIHYKNGIPPIFNKKFFKFDTPPYYVLTSPYDVILEHNPNINTNYLHQVIRSYKRRHNK